jgi:ABC-type phosphate/phosphonate transport system permease subunit
MRIFKAYTIGLLALLIVLAVGATHAASSVVPNALSASSTTTTGVSSSLPSQLLPFASIIGVILTFVDGLIFGVAVKKAITSVILVVVALLLAGFIGLTIPFLSTSNIMTHLLNILISQARLIGPLIYALPLFWIVGFALGIWKG